ncbi:hypothetical protein FW320_25075 [Azospirillum sp. Vi22]|nr:hypothetical protein [Azospirillum baldaniorum]
MTIITKASLADERNISRARVTQYCQRGMPVRSDGKLDRETCLNWVKENIDATQRHDRGAAVAEVLAGRFQPQPSARPAEPNRAGPPAGYEAVKLAGSELHAGALTMGLAMVTRNAASAVVWASCGWPSTTAPTGWKPPARAAWRSARVPTAACSPF